MRQREEIAWDIYTQLVGTNKTSWEQLNQWEKAWALKQVDVVEEAALELRNQVDDIVLEKLTRKDFTSEDWS